MLTLPSSVKIFIYSQPADMRCGFNKLSMFAENFMLQDPFSGHLFVFFNKAGDKCKILFWDRTGFFIWYKRLEEGTFEKLPRKNNQPSIEVDIAALVWEITKANTGWGRVRVANQLALLKISLAASTVRNILNQPRPRIGPETASKPEKVEEEIARSIPAWYPNHVWSIDTTMVNCWGLWPIHICVVIDHFSRKVVAAAYDAGRISPGRCVLQQQAKQTRA